MSSKKGDLSLALDLEAMKQDAPVNTVLSNFMIPDGPGLELLTRTTPNLARAGEICLIYGTMIEAEDGTPGIPYMRDLFAQLMRFAVSMDGKGRQEQIDALQAGGKLPDSYFDKGNSTFEVQE